MFVSLVLCTRQLLVAVTSDTQLTVADHVDVS